MRIIPAIDIIDGKCVRLTKGDYSTKKVYNEDPLEVAMAFEDHGIKHLHLVDLDGAKSQHVINYRVLEKLASKTKLQIDFGGGIKSDEDLHMVFESGARQATGGSIAVKDRSLFLGWLQRYGADRIILGADCKDGRISVSGWQEASTEEVVPFIKSYQKKGIEYVICTEISKDGMLTGPAFSLYRDILKETTTIETTIGPSGVEDREVPGIKLIASGGISAMEELPKLAAQGCEGVIIGKAIYEGRITLKELEDYIIGNS